MAYQELRDDLQRLFDSDYGQDVCLKFYSVSGATSGYDDGKVLVQSGNTLWCRGMKQPISSKFGSTDAQLVQQGRILFDDSKLYVNGSVYTNGTQPIKVGIGSPSPVWFRTLPEGVDTSPDVGGETVYKKFYLRYLQNGSLAGE